MRLQAVVYCDSILSTIFREWWDCKISAMFEPKDCGKTAERLELPLSLSPFCGVESTD